jgi:hypothetical protein
VHREELFKVVPEVRITRDLDGKRADEVVVAYVGTSRFDFVGGLHRLLWTLLVRTTSSMRSYGCYVGSVGELELMRGHVPFVPSVDLSKVGLSSSSPWPSH